MALEGARGGEERSKYNPLPPYSSRNGPRKFGMGYFFEGAKQKKLFKGTASD
jgi:hypothetical protein